MCYLSLQLTGRTFAASCWVRALGIAEGRQARTDDSVDTPNTRPNLQLGGALQLTAKLQWPLWGYPDGGRNLMGRQR